MDDKPKCSGVECESITEKHFTCGECLHSHVMACVEAGRENPDILNARQGRIFCPSYRVGCDCEKPFGHSQIAGFVLETTFDDYLSGYHQMAKQKALQEVQKQVYDQLHNSASAVVPEIDATISQAEADETQKRALEAISQHLLAQQLQIELGGRARMCGRCTFGPVDHAACDDLTSHHQQDVGNGVRINNACSRCGWFSSNVQDWPLWDGKLAIDSMAETDGQGQGGGQAEIRERLQAADRTTAREWACGACSYRNGLGATECAICQTIRPTEAPAEASAAALGSQAAPEVIAPDVILAVHTTGDSTDTTAAQVPAEDESELRRGCEVVIHGLVNASQLNGSTAIVRNRRNGSTEAYAVDVTGLGRRMIRRENIRVVEVMDRSTSAL
jgi:hypothetical protein